MLPRAASSSHRPERRASAAEACRHEGEVIDRPIAEPNVRSTKYAPAAAIAPANTAPQLTYDVAVASTGAASTDPIAGASTTVCSMISSGWAVAFSEGPGTTEWP